MERVRRRRVPPKESRSGIPEPGCTAKADATVHKDRLNIEARRNPKRKTG
jgi:hypothetical protein